jgi:DNA-binding NarL/FixJ family response regulator
MTGAPVLPLAASGTPVRYVVIDDEPRYRIGLGGPDTPLLEQAGSYDAVETFLAIQREPCHVVVLDLCLNRQTGDLAVLHGVKAIRQLTGLGHRVLVHTADERPDPVARCVVAGAAGYISKYANGEGTLAQAVAEVGHHGYVHSPLLTAELRELTRRSPDIRLSGSVEETLTLLGHGLTDRDIAQRRHLSIRTIEDHKSKILDAFGDYMRSRNLGFEGLTRDLGIGPGDLVNDLAGTRPVRGAIANAITAILHKRADRKREK